MFKGEPNWMNTKKGNATWNQFYGMIEKIIKPKDSTDLRKSLDMIRRWRMAIEFDLMSIDICLYSSDQTIDCQKYMRDEYRICLDLIIEECKRNGKLIIKYGNVYVDLHNTYDHLECVRNIMLNYYSNN